MNSSTPSDSTGSDSISSDGTLSDRDGSDGPGSDRDGGHERRGKGRSRVKERLGQFAKKALGWAPLIIVSAVVWSVAGPLLDHTPLTHDHPTHLFKAWHFYEKMLPEFRLRGFSHYWVFGHPAGELVPFGEEVWVALFRALTFEKLSWMRTYSVSLIGMMGLIALAAYVFAKRYFGPLVGTISALLVVWDPGAWAQMGWYWFMKLGVWPNSFGVALLLLAVVALEKVLDRFSPSRFVGASLLVAASLLTHQITLVFLPIFLTLMIFDRWVGKRLTGSGIKNALVAVALGASLSAFYVVPMVARGNLTIDLGVAGVPLDNVGQRLVDGQLFHGLWGVLVPLGFVGGFVALRRRVPGAVFLCLGIGVFVLGSTNVAFSVLHLERVLPLLTKVEASRMLVGAKVLWFPLVAYALSLPIQALVHFVQGRWVRPEPLEKRVPWRWVAAWALALSLLGPYAPSAIEKLYSAQIAKELPPENVAFFGDLKKVWATTKRLRKESDDLYRIAYDLPMHDHIATLAPVFDDTWIYKVGYTPTQTFVRFPMYFDDELFQKMQVKYVVSQRKLPKRSFEPMGTFGQLRLYRFTKYEGKPLRLDGGGDAEVLEFAPERIALRLRDTSKESRLSLYVSLMDHWRATSNGKPIAISPATVKGPQDPFLMEVPASDGHLVFEYVPRLPDIVGRVLSLGAVATFFGWMGLYRPRKKRGTLPEFVKKALAGLGALKSRVRLTQKTRWFVLGLVLAAVAVAMGLKLQSRSALVNPRSLFRSVTPGALTLDDSVCEEVQPLVFSCGPNEVEAKWVSGLYGSHLCMSAPDGQRLVYRSKHRFSDALNGRYDTRPGPGTIVVRVEGEPPNQVRARHRDQGQQFLRFDTREHSGKDRELEIEIRGSALHCFDFHWED